MASSFQRFSKQIDFWNLGKTTHHVDESLVSSLKNHFSEKLCRKIEGCIRIPHILQVRRLVFRKPNEIVVSEIVA